MSRDWPEGEWSEVGAAGETKIRLHWVGDKILDIELWPEDRTHLVLRMPNGMTFTPNPECGAFADA